MARERCTAKSKRTGERCRQWPSRGKDKCKWHGGATPIKHGLYSKYGPPDTVAKRIEELVRDPRVVDLKQYAARLFALIETLEGRLAEKDEVELGDHEALIPLLREGIRAAEKFHRLAVDNRFVDLVEARALIGRSLEAVLRFVPEERRTEALNAVGEVMGDDDAVASAPRGLH